MIKSLVVIGGGGGRESALLKLAANCGLTCFALVKVLNPSVLDYCGKENAIKGDFSSDSVKALLDTITDAETAIFWVSSDEALGMGVVDELRRLGVPPKSIIGPTAEAARIETDKIFSMQLVSEIFPKITPKFKAVESSGQLADVIKDFKNKKLDVVVKPVGLTGGKGVKVMPVHLPTYEAAEEYANICLENDKSVLIVEKLSGIEVSIMGLTDGEVLLSMHTTYDNPYRFAGDTGPGTGGMGSFSVGSPCLPFMKPDELKQCHEVMSEVITKLKELNLHFSGVLYGSFFLTAEGIKFLEFNARFGDPECMNFCLAFAGDFRNLIYRLANGGLEESDLNLSKSATLVKYLVHPKYCLNGETPVEFDLNVSELGKMGIEVFFSSCEKVEERYCTVGTSRTVALGCIGDSIVECSERLNSGIESHLVGDLDFRSDIGSSEQLETLMKMAV
jgi:phosphoribosylamine---glycine ligase